MWIAMWAKDLYINIKKTWAFLKLRGELTCPHLCRRPWLCYWRCFICNSSTLASHLTDRLSRWLAKLRSQKKIWAKMCYFHFPAKQKICRFDIYSIWWYDDRYLIDDVLLYIILTLIHIIFLHITHFKLYMCFQKNPWDFDDWNWHVGHRWRLNN